jgi:hypothetical protein
VTRRRAWALAAAAVAVAVVAVVAVLLARGDGGREGWQAPAPLPAPATARATAAAGDGTVLAVWTEERRGRTAVRASQLEPGGAWSPPATIQAPQTWQASHPTLAVGPRGDAVAVWSWTARSRSVLMASRRPAGGAWEPPQALAPAVHGTYSPAVAVDGDGAVAVAFGHDEGPMAATVRRPDAAWADPAALPPGAGGAPQVAIAPDGRAFVATAGAPDVRLVTLGPGEDRWRTVTLPETGPTGAGFAAAALAIDARGDAVLAWTRPRRGTTTLWTATLSDDRWTPPRALDTATDGQGISALTAAPTARGVVVAWSRWRTPWTRVVVRAATGDGPARTVAGFTIPDARGGPGRPTPGPPPGWVLAGAGGDPVVMWDRLVARDPARRSALEVARMDGAGGWTTPERVTDAPVAGYPLAIGHRGDGLVAAWAQYPAPGAPGARVLASERFG